MDNETWMNAHKAVELGFADKIMFTADDTPAEDTEFAWNKAGLFSRSAVTNSLLGKIPKPEQKPTGTPIESLDKRLSLLSH